MPITDKQSINRSNYIGSSDAAAILGLDKYRTAADVYLEKTGTVEPMPANEAITVGRYCEDAVLQWFADSKGLKLIRNQFRVAENKIQAAHMDALVPDDPSQAIEAKTHGITSNRIAEGWGETETDEVPDYVALQCYHQMAVIPTLQIIWVPVLLGGVGFRFYRIERKQDLIDNLTTAELQFWINYVLQKTMPTDEIPSRDVLKRLIRVPDKTVELPVKPVLQWLHAKKALADAQQSKDDAERFLLAALGDAEQGESELGTLSYLQRTRKAYEVQESTYRQLTFKKVRNQ